MATHWSVKIRARLSPESDVLITNGTLTSAEIDAITNSMTKKIIGVIERTALFSPVCQPKNFVIGVGYHPNERKVVGLMQLPSEENLASADLSHPLFTAVGPFVKVSSQDPQHFDVYWKDNKWVTILQSRDGKLHLYTNNDRVKDAWASQNILRSEGCSILEEGRNLEPCSNLEAYSNLEE